MENNLNEKIILFYKYVSIPEPNAIREWLLKLCKDFGFTGRLILAHEGINGTLGGKNVHIQRFQTLLAKHTLFDGIDWKESEGGSHSFPRLRIVVKNEITHLGLDPKKIVARDGGIHLKPEETHALLTNKPDNLVLLDARNNFEWSIGSFSGAIKPPIDYFRELPGYIDKNIDDFKDKKVLMFCTGGIRCERASAYLKSKGVAQAVYQMEGGIHRYAEKYPEGFFRGKNYVFDGRIAVKINDDIVGSCLLCATPCDDYTNCLNASCNKHFIACAQCQNQYKSTCGTHCQELLRTNKVKPRPQRLPLKEKHGTASRK